LDSSFLFGTKRRSFGASPFITGRLFRRGDMLKLMAGMLCGTAIGILIAPAPGSQTRRRLIQAARNPEELGREAVANIREKAGEMGANLGRQAAEKAVDRVAPEKLSSQPRRTGS
jgi:gas vesicle protein